MNKDFMTDWNIAEKWSTSFHNVCLTLNSSFLSLDAKMR